MSPEERSQKIAHFCSAICGEEENEPWGAAREMLVPVLRGATYGMELWMKKPDAAFIRRPFLPYIDLLVALDRPTSMSFVGRPALERWNVDEREVFEAAARVVPDLANASVASYDESHGPLWIVTADDTYEASRLLVPGWLAAFRGKVEGNPIAIIPERATLMVGGDARDEMIARLLDKAEREFKASTRRLSPAIYTVNSEGKVIPFVRPGSDPLARKMRLAHEQLAMYEHREQKESLDRFYERNGPDVFVASYQVFEGSDGIASSLTVWTKGVRSYLPRAERVALVVMGERDAKPRVMKVPFEVIENRLTAVPHLHPARFETTGLFPTDEELRSMGEVQ